MAQQLTQDEMEEAVVWGVIRVIGYLFIIAVAIFVIYGFGWAIFTEGHTRGLAKGYQEAQDDISENLYKYGSAGIMTSKGEIITLEKHYDTGFIFNPNFKFTGMDVTGK